jgi:hypothetical protein
VSEHVAEPRRAIGPESGTSPARERRWGRIGGTLGSLYGVGAALIAIFVEGAPWWPTGTYPPFFATPRLLTFDVYMTVALATGLGFLVAALVLARRSPYPRTDVSGAGLTGLVLTATSGAILFTRLLAIVARG